MRSRRSSAAKARQAAARDRARRRRTTPRSLRAASIASGLTDFLTLLQSEQSLLSARDQLAAAQADQALALVQLYLALGGGWQPDAAQSDGEPRHDRHTDIDEFPRPAAALALAALAQMGLHRRAAADRAAAAVALLPPGAAGPYATAPVERHDLTVTVSATGNLAPTNQVNVGSEESGLVNKVFVHNNDRVVKGQPLAQLDLSRLHDALVQSQATLQAALATVAQNRATRRPDQGEARPRGAGLQAVRRQGAVADRARHRARRLCPRRRQVAPGRRRRSRRRAPASRPTRPTCPRARSIRRSTAWCCRARSSPARPSPPRSTSRPCSPSPRTSRKMKLEVKVDEADVGEVHAGRAGHLHRRRLSRPDLPGDGDAGRSRRQCHAQRQQRRHHRDHDHQRGRLYRRADRREPEPAAAARA